MENKDNVYEENTDTQAVAVAEESAVAQGEKDALAVLGKFKDVNALARAYGALEAEFTKRSQRLKELERLADNLQDGNGLAALGAEKLRKHAKARKEAAKAFDEFVATVGKAHTDAAATDCEPANEVQAAEKNAADKTQTLGLEKDEKEGGGYALKEESAIAAQPDGEGQAAELEKALAQGERSLDGAESVEKRNAEAGSGLGEQAFPTVANHGNAEASSEELYQRASRDERVRLKIIGEYLSSIEKSGAPLTANGAGMPIAPPLRAKSIGDAGAMALQFFKQPYKNQ